MNQLLKQERILFDSVMNKETDSATVSAFYDYANFLSKEGVLLVAHLHNELKERQNEIDEYEKLYSDIIEKIKRDTSKLQKLVKKLGLKDNPMFLDRFKDVQNFIDGNWSVPPMTCFDNIRLDYMDILRRLDKLGYVKEIEPYTIVYSAHNPKPKDAYAFEDRKKYYSLLKAFDKKHSRSVIGALMRMMGTLADLNNPESESSYTRSSLVAHVDKVHNSIIFNNPEINEDSSENKDKIFWIDGDDIHHYKIGKLNYRKRGSNDPKYIQAFKNVINYVPAGTVQMGIPEFKKKIHKTDRFNCNYRTSIGKSARSFIGFLKKNRVKNIHPKSNMDILDVTDDYITFLNNL